MSEFRPAARVLSRGNLIALTGANAVIVYSTYACNNILGSFSSPRGYRLTHFLESATDKENLASFLDRLKESNLKLDSNDTCTVRTRCGISVVIQSNNNAMYTGSFASPPKIISVMPESGRQEGLLTMAYAPGTSPDEMSFSDAFEHAAVEW
eukprot:CAMPEP_0185029658 /NCGR_PEP_ID=MMETSP1103-20130426/16077_1 /TAXON_ID=36769 /ORGANISM="Paraphysomonas bandaiensis, Strain Caron Lab Isolate" /LENGTH=151 /DNA_ID=CAMNT_0027564475 /DNA_START=18 /DNA_END=470 /DNA_ORIENTATION=-